MLALSIRPAPARSVAVLHDGDGLVSVVPLPKNPTDPQPRQFDDVDEARLFATGLSLCLGAAVIDLTGRPA